MTGESTSRCEYQWNEFGRCTSCCYRETWGSYDQCIWHAEAANDEIKSIEDLQAVRETPENRRLNSESGREIPTIAELLDGAQLSTVEFPKDFSLANCALREADLSRMDLMHADLSRANLVRADLSRSDLRYTDLPRADLRYTNLSGANLRYTDLSGVDLRYTDLSGADLRYTDLSGVDLSGADLSEADIRWATFSDITATQKTRINGPWWKSGLCRRPEWSREWNTLARGYHDIRTEFINQGLDENARDARHLERKAQSLAARASGGINGWMTYAGGLLSQYLTGYGVRVSYVFGWTLLILLLTTVWYEYIGIEGSSVYYSVVTFTTAPLHPPAIGGTVTEAIVLFETYVGTALIVLLGYVLGNREQL